MKRFNQYISEGAKTTEGQVSADSDCSYGMGNLANPEVIERINGINSQKSKLKKFKLNVLYFSFYCELLSATEDRCAWYSECH